MSANGCIVIRNFVFNFSNFCIKNTTLTLSLIFCLVLDNNIFKIYSTKLFSIKTTNYSSQFKSLILCIQGLVFNLESIGYIFLDQCSMKPLLKIFLYLVILTLSSTLKLGALTWFSFFSQIRIISIKIFYQ